MLGAYHGGGYRGASHAIRGPSATPSTAGDSQSALLSLEVVFGCLRRQPDSKPEDHRNNLAREYLNKKPVTLQFSEAQIIIISSTLFMTHVRANACGTCANYGTGASQIKGTCSSLTWGLELR